MFVYYINVPLNQNGIAELETYNEYMANVQTFELTKEEYDFLRQPKGLFQILYENFGIIIGVCEEERIENCNLEDALQCASNMLRKCNDSISIAAVQKIIDSLKCAKKAGTFWEIDIYLE